MRKSVEVKILSFSQSHSRQGADLSDILTDYGHSVRLYQFDDVKSHGITSKYKRIGIKIPDILNKYKLLNRIPFIKGGLRKRLFALRDPFIRKWLTKLLFVLHATRGRCGVVIAINYPALFIGVLIARINKAQLVYYPLEYVHKRNMMRREANLCEKNVSLIINVESNRLNLLKSSLRREIASFVVPNAPRRGIPTGPRGRLVEYLTKEYGFASKDKLVIYHGVYHKHAYLEGIISGTPDWPNHVRFVVMITGVMPETFTRLILRFREKVTLVPPVKYDELFEWVRDATIGLLSYEDELSLNVRYCSPQKMFDLLACGVPFIGSKRPLIEEIAEKSKAGVCIDMKNREQLACAIKSMLAHPDRLEEMSQNARKAYEDRCNYDTYIMPAIKYIEDRF